MPNFNRLTLAIVLACSAWGAAAKSYDQVGAPPAELPALGSYAMEGTSAKAGLRQVVPAGWQVLVHKAAVLPPSMTWSAGDTWTQALQRFAQDNNLSVLVDWDKRSVYLRPPELAVREAMTREQVANAASTPLPALTPAPAAVPRALVDAPQPAPAVDPKAVEALANKLIGLEGELARMKEQREQERQSTETSVKQVRDELERKARDLDATKAELAEARKQAQAAAQKADAATQAAQQATQSVKTQPDPQTPTAAGPAQASATVVGARAGVVETVQPLLPAQPVVATTPSQGEYESLTVARAFNRESIKAVAEHVARTHGAALRFDVAESLRLPGVVTVLGADLGEDARLLARATGAAASVQYSVCRSPALLWVHGTDSVQPPCTAALIPLAAAGGEPLPLERRAQAAAATAAASAAAPGAEASPAVLPPGTGAAVQQRAAVASVPVAAANPDVASTATEPAARTTEPSAAPASFVLAVPAGADFESALRSALQDVGYALTWDSADAYQADTDSVTKGKDIAAVLEQLLPRMGLQAEVHTSGKVVRISSRTNEVRN